MAEWGSFTRLPLGRGHKWRGQARSWAGAGQGSCIWDRNSTWMNQGQKEAVLPFGLRKLDTLASRTARTTSPHPPHPLSSSSHPDTFHGVGTVTTCSFQVKISPVSCKETGSAPRFKSPVEAF